MPLGSTPEGWITFEAAYTAAVHAVGAPVPTLLGMDRIDDRAVSIYERVDGRSMWAHMVDRPAQVPSLGRSLAELQAGLFTLVPAVSLPAQRDRLTSKIRSAAARCGESLLDALDHVPPDVPGARLCHGDLHPGNVILGRAGPIIIDWFDASRGDPAADIARTVLLQSPRGNGPRGPDHLAGATRQLLATASQAYLVAITELVPVERDDLERLIAVAAVARLAEGVEAASLITIWDEWRERTVVPPHA